MNFLEDVFFGVSCGPGLGAGVGFEALESLLTSRDNFNFGFLGFVSSSLITILRSLDVSRGNLNTKFRLFGPDFDLVGDGIRRKKSDPRRTKTGLITNLVNPN